MNARIYLTLTMLLALLCNLQPQIHAQSIGTINLSKDTYPDKISAISGGGYLTVGSDKTNANRLMTYLDADLNPIWALSFVTSDVLGLRKGIQLNDGNFAFMFTRPTNGSSVAVLKVDPSGNILFVKEYQFASGSMDAFAFAPAATGDNGYILGGGQCSQENYLIKCDAAGDVDWSYAYVDPTFTGVQTVWDILPDASGYTIASTYSLSGLDANAWRVDLSGNLQYSKLFQLPTLDRPRKLLSAPGNGFVMQCSDDIEGGDDVFLWINSGGSVTNHKSYTGSVSIDSRDFSIDANGNLVIVGTSSNGPQTSKMFAMGTDANGNVTWQKLSKLVSNAGTSQGLGIARAISGNYALLSNVTGFNLGCVVTVTDGAGSGFCVQEALTVTAGSAGQLIESTRTFNRSSPTVNVFNLNLTPQSFTYSPTLKCGAIVSTEPVAPAAAYTLAPNPGQGNIVLSHPAGFSDAHIQIFSATGALVWSAQSQSGTALPLSIAALPSGIYWLQVTDGDQRQVLKYVQQ